MIRVFLMHGGIASTDGVVTSVGMKRLVSMLREQIPGVEVQEYLWGNWAHCYWDIVSRQKINNFHGDKFDDRVAVVGYSGGGARATWVANGNLKNDGTYSARPVIDLMVTYDPSPTWSMMPIDSNVKKAVNYWNQTPMMFGIGGARLVRKELSASEKSNIIEVKIYMQHLAVQFSGQLHQRTVDYVKELEKNG